MISQQSIIKALYDNKCPKCGRNHMYVTDNHVECGFCLNRWELEPSVKRDYVRVCDTLTYKQQQEEEDVETCPNCKSDKIVSPSISLVECTSCGMKGSINPGDLAIVWDIPKGFITDRRKVLHVNQGKTEYWQHHSVYGWMPVLDDEGGTWLGGTYEYYELRHPGQEWEGGWIGPIIKHS